MTTACTSRALICCHLVATCGTVRSAGRFFTLVAALKCRRSSGSWFDSDVGRLLVMTKELVPEMADAESVGANVAPSTTTERAIAAKNRLVTDTGYRLKSAFYRRLRWS